MANVIEIVIKATDQATAQIRGAAVAVEGLAASANGLLAAVGGPLGVAAALGAAGLAGVAMANKLSDSVEQLTNLSTVTGVSVNGLRVLRQIMTEAGKSPDSLNGALGILKRKLEDNDPALRKIVGNTNDVMEALRLVSEAAAGGRGASAAFAAFGRSGLELAPILPGLTNSIQDMSSRLGELSPATLAAAKSWDTMMDHMKTSTKSFLDQAAGLFLQFVASVKGWWAEVLRFNSTMAHLGPTGALKPNTLPENQSGAGGPGAADPFANFRNFPDTSAGPTERRGNRRGMTGEEWQKITKVWNDADPVARRLVKDIESLHLDLQMAAFSAESLGYAALNAFDSIIFQGMSAAKAIREAFISAIRDITNEFAKIGIGFGLEALGGLFGGPIGAAVGRVGGRFIGRNSLAGGGGGNTIILNTLDSQTMRAALQPGGSLNRAQDQVRIGSRY